MLNAMMFRADGHTPDGEIAITKYGFENFGDDPKSHRWRAWWGTGGDDWRDGCGIYLQCYPVIRATPAGVWIANNAYWDGSNWQNLSLIKWVMDGSGSAWAKHTQEAAIRSLAIRLSRWASLEESAVFRIKQAAVTLKKLRPDLPSYTESILEKFGGTAP